MSFKATLTQIASLTLLLSSSINAAPLFKTATGPEFNHEQTRANQLKNTKANIKNAWVYRIEGDALDDIEAEIELNLYPELSVFAEVDSVDESSGGTVLNAIVTRTQNNGESSANDAGKEVDHDAGKEVDHDAGKEVDHDSVILINNEGKISGTIRANGKLFMIRPLHNGLHLITEQNEKSMKPVHSAAAMALLEQELVEREANQSDSDDENYPSEYDEDETPVIRVMVLYSNGVERQVVDVRGLVELAVAETNQGYINSDINARVELAHFDAIDYNPANMSKDMARLKSTDDGRMDEVHTLRTEHGADVVMLIVPDRGHACGLAGAIGADASTAFAVVAQDCAAGYYSFGHELGHLMSARHNYEHDSEITPFEYGHGYQDPNGQWRTIMSYNCDDGCPRINVWSSPQVTTIYGEPMGDEWSSDNASVLNETAATVASFED